MKRLVAAAVLCTFLSISPASYSRSAACPRDSQPITNDDRPAAKRAVLRYLRRTYHSPALINGKPLKGDLLRGAQLSASLAPSRHAGFGLVPRFECGARVWRRTMVVSVFLPTVARQSGTDLAELTFFASKTRSGWHVWERAH